MISSLFTDQVPVGLSTDMDTGIIHRYGHRVTIFVVAAAGLLICSFVTNTLRFHLSLG